MESLIKRNIRLDNNLIDEIKTLCEDEGFTFSDLVRQVIVNDGFVVLNRIDIDIKKSFVLSRLKNLTSQYKSIISEANISDEFIYTLEYKVDTIESIIIDELKIDNKKHTPDNESYKEICYIPSEEKTHRSYRVPKHIFESFKAECEHFGYTVTEGITESITNAKFITPICVEIESRKLVELVRFGNCINAYLKTLHIKRKNDGLTYLEYRDLEDKLEMFIRILVHKLAMVGIERP